MRRPGGRAGLDGRAIEPRTWQRRTQPLQRLHVGAVAQAAHGGLDGVPASTNTRFVWQLSIGQDPQPGAPLHPLVAPSGCLSLLPGPGLSHPATLTPSQEAVSLARCPQNCAGQIDKAVRQACCRSGRARPRAGVPAERAALTGGARHIRAIRRCSMLTRQHPLQWRPGPLSFSSPQDWECREAKRSATLAGTLQSRYDNEA